MPLRILLVAWLLLAPALSLQAETRVETSSRSGFPDQATPNLVEVDVSSRWALGMRSTDLGSREDTNELFLRLTRLEESRALDPRDKRKTGMNNPFAGMGALHIGVVGVEFDGSRGNPMSVRAGLYGLSRLQGKLFSVTEFTYQTGTFGGDGSLKQNKGGMYSRVGMRQNFDDNFYAETDYSFSPGTDRSWEPRFRLGLTF